MRARRTGLQLLLILPLVLFIACSGDGKDDNASGPLSDGQSFTTDDEDAAVLDVLLDNLKAVEAEDIDASMEGLDPESAIYEPTRRAIRFLFETFDIDYEILELEVTSRTDDEAVIQFTQETRKLSGPDFRDSRVVGRHLLHKRDGKWLIYQSFADEVTYLDEE